MIIRVGDKYYVVAGPITKRIIERLENKRLADTSIFRDVMVEYGRKPVYDRLTVLNKKGIILVEKKLFPRNKIFIRYLGKRVYFIDWAIGVSSAIAMVLYLLSLYLIKTYLYVSITGFILGSLTIVLIAILLWIKLMFDKIEVIK